MVNFSITLPTMIGTIMLHKTEMMMLVAGGLRNFKEGH